MTALARRLRPTLNRSGVAWDQVSLAPLGDLPSRPVVPMLDIPIPERVNFKPSGTDAFGFVCGYHAGLGSHARTNDGGVTWEPFTITGLATLGYLWLDRDGNKYTASGKNVYRATAGEDSWAFALCFTFAEGYPTWFSFACDDNGGVYFAEYQTSGLDTRGTQFWRSTDGGATWESQVIDYNQKHLHAAHVHQPSGKLYLMIGEVYPGGPTLPALAEDFRGALVSDDQGATFTQIQSGDGSYADGVQHTVGVTRGDLVYWGKDQTPSGFGVLDTTTDTWLPDVLTHTVVGTSFNWTGFYFAAVEHDGILLTTPANTSGNGYFPVVALIAADQAGAVSSPLHTEKAVGGFCWIDSNGNVWTQDATDIAYGEVFKMPKVRHKRAYGVHDTATLVAAFNFDASPKVIAELHEGKRLLRIDSTTPTAFTPTAAVLEGDTLQIAWITRRGPGAADNLRLECRFEDSGGSLVQTKYIVCGPNNLPTDTFTHSTASTTVPAGAVTVRCRWQQFAGTSTGVDHYHDVSSDLTVTKHATWPTWAPDGAFGDSLDLSEAVGSSFLFTDRLYLLGYSGLWTASVDVPLLTINHVDVGVRRAASGVGGEVYVKESDAEVASWPAGTWGGMADKDHKPSLTISDKLLRMHLIPAPILVSAQVDRIQVYSPQLSSLDSVALDTPLEGTLEVSMLGSALHLPRLWSSVPSGHVDSRFVAA